MSKIDPNSILNFYKTLKTSATNINNINALKRNSLIMNGFVPIDNAEAEQNDLMQNLEAESYDEEDDEEEEHMYPRHYYQPRPVPVLDQKPPLPKTEPKNEEPRDLAEKVDRPTPTLSTTTAVSSASTAATTSTVQSHQAGRLTMKAKVNARGKRHSLAPKRNSTVLPGHDQAKKLFLNKKYLVQMELVERFIWDFKQNYNMVDEHLKSSSNMHISEQLHRLLINSKYRRQIYDYFKMIQFQKCCALLVNLYRSFEQKITTSSVTVEEVEQPSSELQEKMTMPIMSDTTEDTYDEKLLIYYCTICALYPSLYTTQLPSSADSLDSESERESELTSRVETDAEQHMNQQQLRRDQSLASMANSVTSELKLPKRSAFQTSFSTNELSFDFMAHVNLETTSEGLCDHVREIFAINRHVFSEYQIKAMKKLLSRKSHAQTLKEELQRQVYIIQNDQHSYYKKENFQSSASYSTFKDRLLCSLRNLMNNFNHVQVEDEPQKNQAVLAKYTSKLKYFVLYYEKLVEKIFNNISASSEQGVSIKLGNNSKRLLKEFQLRYCVDTFDAIIIELKLFVKIFPFETSIFGILINYLKNIYLFLNLNKIPNEPQIYSIPINTLLNLYAILENLYSRTIAIIKNLKAYYPDGNTREINLLVQLLQEINSLNELLNRTTSISVTESIRNYLEIGLEKLYMETKESIMEKASGQDSKKRNYESNIVYSMIIFCREQIQYYSRAVSKSFSMYLDVSSISINTLYRVLMKDVKALCEEHLEELYDSNKLNLNLLALAYRLNQLDYENRNYIKLEQQVWRNYFLPQLSNWIITIGKICSKMIHRHFIPNDDYKENELKPVSMEPIGNRSANPVHSLQSPRNTGSQDEQHQSSSSPGHVVDGIKSAFRPFINQHNRSMAESNTTSTSRSSSVQQKEDRFHDSRRRKWLANQHTQVGSSDSKEVASSMDTRQPLAATLANSRSKSLTSIDRINTSLDKTLKMMSGRGDESTAEESSIHATENNSSSLKESDFSEKKDPVMPPAEALRIENKSAFKRIETTIKRDSIGFIPNRAANRNNSVDSIAFSNSSSKAKSSIDATGMTFNFFSDFGKFSCSNSLVDLIVLMFRYKDVCEKLIDLIAPIEFINQNYKLFQIKFICLNNIYQVLFNYLNIYMNNIMSLDICATSKTILEGFFGKEIITDIFSGKHDDSLWGCRHHLRGSKYGCNFYINRSSKYISDKYEPINEMMCVRLNNLSQLKEVRKYFYEKYTVMMQKQYNLLVKLKSTRQTESLVFFQQYKIENYKMKDLNKQTEVRLNKTLCGLSSLLVYRLNLFCRKAKFLLLSEELNSYQINMRVKPLVDFLNGNFAMLKQKLYDNLFAKLVKLLWLNFYDSFVELLSKFDAIALTDSKATAFAYSKMIDILANKFKENSLSQNYLDSKNKQLKLILELYAQDSNNLILLYYKLFNFNFQKNSSKSMLKLPDHFDLAYLIKMWKRLKKPFNGKFFIKFLKKNPPGKDEQQTDDHTNIFDRDQAIRYAQSLLEANFIMSAVGKQKRNKTQKKRRRPTISGADAKPTVQDPLDLDPYLEQSRASSSMSSLFNFDQIFLATKTNYYQLNPASISKLTENLLYRNKLLNQEIEMLYPTQGSLNRAKHDHDSNVLLDKCLENAFDHEFILKTLWHRVYNEPIVMKFISMRYSNYINNLSLSPNGERLPAEASAAGNAKDASWANSVIPMFPM